MRARLCWRATVLTEVEVCGHAPALALCEASSCLLRSCALAVQSLQPVDALDKLDWSLDLPQEGRFFWQLRRWPQEFSGRLQGISLVLAVGLRRLAGDYSTLKLREEWF